MIQFISCSFLLYTVVLFSFILLFAHVHVEISSNNQINYIYIIIFLSDEGPMLETLDHTIRIGSTPTFLYFDLYIYIGHVEGALHSLFNEIESNFLASFEKISNFSATFEKNQQLFGNFLDFF